MGLLGSPAWTLSIRCLDGLFQWSSQNLGIWAKQSKTRSSILPACICKKHLARPGQMKRVCLHPLTCQLGTRERKNKKEKAQAPAFTAEIAAWPKVDQAWSWVLSNQMHSPPLPAWLTGRGQAEALAGADGWDPTSSTFGINMNNFVHRNKTK
jgi:hypothetical protein